MGVAGMGGMDMEQDCSVCMQLRLEGARPVDFEVAPAAGGGWPRWGAALTRLFTRVGHNPTQALIVEQPSCTSRYVQLLIGHGQAHAEAASNVYLKDDSRLSAEQEELLARIGWRAPACDFDDREEMPANWTLPLVSGDWQGLAQMVLATIAGVFVFDERQGVKVVTFQADHPCIECFPQVAA
jgi:hypothetical protein